ncbi:hypothetical protein FA15DRAFT_244210 [Coprinopsis marcescibilis]|uniref:Uncharacterized protein n=1 Tax=Coprinopsis marcescibilis TaxID=230819 RepID=A0A5C3KF66_COPMA|nr:hypothetical protein FA15DRAFT_244210 [Coprinopsis marcescibilis]
MGFVGQCAPLNVPLCTMQTQSRSSNGPPPQPFNGHPPPIPTHLTQSINPTQWQAGYWQANPHYNPGMQQAYIPAARPVVPWMASQMWQQPRPHQPQGQQPQQQQPQQQQQQVVNPYKRVAKPPSAEYLAMPSQGLGLINMDASKSLYNDAPPENTPWIWQTKPLEEEEGTDSGGDSGGEDGDTDEDEPPANYKARGRAVAAAESFTTKLELKPTFSPGIVRTPDFYQRRASSVPIDETLTSRMNQMGMSSTPTPSSNRPGSYSRQSSSSSQISDGSSSSASISGVSTLSDEPMSILSPLMIAGTPKPATSARTLAEKHHNSIARHATLTTIHEGPNQSVPRTATMPNVSTASAYAASLTNNNGTPSRASPNNPVRYSSPSNSRPTSQQPSPVLDTQKPQTPPTRSTYPPLNYARSPPPHAAPPPQHHATYPLVGATSYSRSPAPSSTATNSISSSLPPPPSSAPASYPTKSPPPNTTGSYPTSFSPSTSTPTRPGIAASQSWSNSYYNTPPNSGSLYSSSFNLNSSTGSNNSNNNASTPSRSSSRRNSAAAITSTDHHQVSTYPQQTSTNSLPPLSSGVVNYHAYPTPPSGSSSSPPKPTTNSSPPKPHSSASNASYPYGSSNTSYSHTNNPAFPATNSSATYGSSHTSYHQQPPQPQPAPTPRPTVAPVHPVVAPPGTMRKGFWNSRGDYLTPTGYIVYAPQPLAFPPDLAHYPPPPSQSPTPSSDSEHDDHDHAQSGGRDSRNKKKDSKRKSKSPPSTSASGPAYKAGYLNEHGTYAQWVSRPELPESLPRMGRQPEKPYEGFIEWIPIESGSQRRKTG